MALVDQIVALLPQGQGWPRSSAGYLWQTVNLFTGAYQRILNWADYAQQDTFPITAQDSVDVWQKSFSLPDPPCPPLTPQQQKTQMIQRVENLGGQSVAYYVAMAARIGYTISITELTVPRAGLSKAGCASNGSYGDFTWVVSVANAALTEFRAGQNRAGDPLSTASS